MNDIRNDGCAPCNSNNCHTEVSCDVKNCVHHDGQKLCTAGMIHVGPNHANDSKDTVCSTFKSR